MKQPKWYRCAVMMSMFGMLFGQLAQAAGPQTRGPLPSASQGSQIADIGLLEGGVLRGQLLTAAGAPEAGASVVLLRDGEAIATAKTGSAGEFSIQNVSGGVHELQTPSGRSIYRLWADRTAPPAAQPGILIVDGQSIHRGQRSPWFQSLGGALANPWILALIVGAAIAIPLALDSDDAS